VDIEQPDSLVPYLRQTGRIGAQECPEVRVLVGGVSNRTVWVRRPNGDHWVLKQALPKLRVAVEWLSAPERIQREALGMRWLSGLLPEGAVPRLIFEDPEHFLLCMSAVPEPHRNWKTMLLEGVCEPDHVEQFARMLAAIHREQSAEARRDFSDTTYFESLRLEPYYAYTAARVPQATGFLNRLMEETRATKRSLVHGDYSPKNILVHEDRLVLLDHEVIHFGDSAFDLGFSFTHLLSKAHHVHGQRDTFARAAKFYWGEYARGAPGSREMESRAVRHTLACLLARVDGRSPLEYLSAAERDRQRDAVLSLMAEIPSTMNQLVDNFIARLD
jgi:aminoglycoside phosphotransferase (APT) family kinase protein